MRVSAIIALVPAIAAAVSCGGISAPLPAAPSTVVPPATASAPGTPTVATASMPIVGAVHPVRHYPAPCWADRYACELFDFTTTREGPIEVTLTWNGAPHALRVQLYWAGEGLAHEDIAPRTGPGLQGKSLGASEQTHQSPRLRGHRRGQPVIYPMLLKDWAVDPWAEQAILRRFQQQDQNHRNDKQDGT